MALINPLCCSCFLKKQQNNKKTLAIVLTKRVGGEGVCFLFTFYSKTALTKRCKSCSDRRGSEQQAHCENFITFLTQAPVQLSYHISLMIVNFHLRQHKIAKCKGPFRAREGRQSDATSSKHWWPR